MDIYLQKLHRAHQADPADMDVASRLISALWRLRTGECKPYTLRNLPCDITSDESLWAVSGSGPVSGGVLEWCYDEEDAKTRLSMMQLDPRYSNLTAHKWEQEPPTPDYNGLVPWDEMTEKMLDLQHLYGPNPGER